MKRYRFRVYSFSTKGMSEWVKEAKPIYKQEWKAKGKPRYRLIARAIYDEGWRMCMY